MDVVEITRQQPRRGRPPRLSIEMILSQAIEQTRSVGLDRFSMKDLASALNAGEMSIYHHVASRSELDRLVVARVAEGFELPDRPNAGAEREWLESIALRMRDVLDEYPGVAQHLLVHGPAGAALPVMNQILDVVEQYGVARAELFRAYSILTTTIVALCVQRTALSRLDGGGLPFEAFRSEVADSGSPGAFLSEQLDGDMDGFFDDAVAVILNGLVRE